MSFTSIDDKSSNHFDRHAMQVSKECKFIFSCKYQFEKETLWATYIDKVKPKVNNDVVKKTPSKTIFNLDGPFILTFIFVNRCQEGRNILEIYKRSLLNIA